MQRRKLKSACLYAILITNRLPSTDIQFQLGYAINDKPISDKLYKYYNRNQISQAP